MTLARPSFRPTHHPLAPQLCNLSLVLRIKRYKVDQLPHSNERIGSERRRNQKEAREKEATTLQLQRVEIEPAAGSRERGSLRRCFGEAECPSIIRATTDITSA